MKVLDILLDLVLKVKYSEILIFKAIFLSDESLQKKSLKNTKMGDKLLSIPYFDNFALQCTLFLKMRQNFDVRYQVKPNRQNISMSVFIDLWSCLFTAKL